MGLNVGGVQSAKRLEIERRTELELTLLCRNFTYRQIAEEVGVSPATVHNDVKRQLRRSAKKNAGLTAEWRELECRRLDAIAREMQRVMAKHHAVLYQGVEVRVPRVDPETGKERLVPLTDDGPVIQAARVLLKVSEDRRRLLGLDVEPTIDLPEGLEATVRIIELRP